MLRYFYLLCLLIAINRTLCNEYISDHNLRHKGGRQLGKKDKGLRHKPRLENKHYVTRKRQGYDMLEDKEPIAQIDVASFIQKPDEYAVDDNFIYGTELKKSKPKVKNYNDYGSLLEYNSDENVVKKGNKRQYYLNPGGDKPFELGPNPFPYKDSINSRYLNLDPLDSHRLDSEKITRKLRNKPSASNYENMIYDMDSNHVHKPDKKCVLKNMMKLPFFSHNKNETSKPKKPKKRKIFCFNCSNKKEKEKTTDELATALHSMKGGAKQEYLGSFDKITITNLRDNLEESKSKGRIREKRQEWNNDRERQLKELNEIQRKVDNVEILSTYDKLPEVPNES